MKVSIEKTVNAARDLVWNAWVTPDDITKWNFANDDWCCPKAENNLQEGERFNYRMEAKDGSMGFDFEGEYTVVKPHDVIAYRLSDGRKVTVQFVTTEDGTNVVETFDAENENSAEEQRQGWLNILEMFKQHVESKGE